MAWFGLIMGALNWLRYFDMRFFVALLSLLVLAPTLAQANAQQQPYMAQPPSIPVSPVMRDRLAAEAAKPRASNAWSRTGAVGGNTAIYLTFVGGTVDDRLLRVSTAWAAKSELHETVVDSAGVVRMLPALAGFALPAKERVMFAPGGKHVMVTGLKRELREGQTFPVNLTFEKAGIVRVMVQVRAAPARAPSAAAPATPAKPAAEDHSHHH